MQITQRRLLRLAARQPASARSKKRATLLVQIRQFFERSKAPMASSRILHDLRKKAIPAVSIVLPG